jgi:hypothetical protein
VDWPKPEVVDEIRAYLAAISDVDEDNLVYFDESFAYTSEAPARGRAPRGQRIYRARETHGKRYMFALAIKKSGPIHPPAISTLTMKDDVFMSYVRAQLVPALEAGDVVVWDRLGKAGRCKNPTKQRKFACRTTQIRWNQLNPSFRHRL